MRHLFLGGLAAVMLAGCGGGTPAEVGPGDNALIGTWQQQGEIPSADGSVVLSEGTVSYAADGTSRMDAVMVVNAPPLPATDQRYRMRADVTWTLDETVLTRSLGTITLSPETETEQSRDIAAQYQAALNASPPARYIVEQLDDSSMALLDPDNGNTIRYKRVAAP